MDKNPKKDKKPIYKKVWFWVVIIFILIGVVSQNKSPQKIGETSNDSNSVSSAPSEAKKEEKTEFIVGDIIASDGKELTVEKVERNWISDNQFIKPKDGKEFIKVSVKIENKSNGEISYNSMFDFKVEDADGSIESPDLISSSNIADYLNAGQLAEGGKKSGSVVFEVPKGSKAKLHYKPTFSFDKKVIVNL